MSDKEHIALYGAGPCIEVRTEQERYAQPPKGTAGSYLEVSLQLCSLLRMQGRSLLSSICSADKALLVDGVLPCSLAAANFLSDKLAVHLESTKLNLVLARWNYTAPPTPTIGESRKTFGPAPDQCA